MRRQLDEPRQVRKEAAVIAMVVCCGVPGLFFVFHFILKDLHEISDSFACMKSV